MNEGDRCELCLDDPGFEVDVYLACTLPDMIYIVRGDLPLTRAIGDGRLEVLGPLRGGRHLGRWLNLSPLAKIKPVRPLARRLPSARLPSLP